jgi:hypothetical protein
MSAKKNNGFRPSIEALEDRRLLANYLVLDFTPDRVPTERVQPAPFASAFNLRYPNGAIPSFLDMNGDRRITTDDVNIGAQAIANRVAQYYSGFNISVRYGDVWNNTNWGQQWLAYGRSSQADQVFVVYVGGYSFGNPGAFGVAKQAPVGTNLEFYAYAFSGTAASAYLSTGLVLPPTPYINHVAQSIAHESGHLLGLGHVPGNPPGDPNIMNYSSSPETAYFPNALYPRIELLNANRQIFYGPQNPAQELVASLRGQPTATATPYSNGGGGVRYQPSADAIGHDHEHEDDHDHANLIAALVRQRRQRLATLSRVTDLAFTADDSPAARTRLGGSPAAAVGARLS